MASALSLSLLLVLSLCTAIAARDLSASIHDLLPEYGLPPGLLPSSATRYTITAGGDITVRLPARCYVEFTPDDLVRYDTVIKGRLGEGIVTGIRGISVQKFIWLNVTEVESNEDGSQLVFKSGDLFEELASSLFDDVPSCGNPPTLLVEA